tara:strand:+ start:837 stop:1001 length:165 start_codon:yes stop_codon:yes gene_type:complete
MPEINDAQRGDIDVDELTPTIRQGQQQIAVGYFWHDVTATLAATDIISWQVTAR